MKVNNLVSKFNIRIPVYGAEISTVISSFISDKDLSKELLRLYFLNKLDRAWIDEGHIYFKRVGGVAIKNEPELLVEKDINALIIERRGGRRNGSGRPSRLPFPTVTIRVPMTLKDDLVAIIDMYVQSYSDNKTSLEGKSNIRQRVHALELIERLAERERLLMENRTRIAVKDEDEKRQMKLFEE